MADRSRAAAYHAPADPAPPGSPGVGWRATLRHALERRGFGERDARRSVWLDARDPDIHRAAIPRVRQALAERRDIGLVLTTAAAASVDRLRRLFPDDIVAATPEGSGVDRFVRRLRPCVLLADEATDARTVTRARRSGVPVLPLSAAHDRLASDCDIARLLPPRGARADPNLPAFAPAWQAPTLRDRVGRSRLWRTVSPRLARRRYDDWNDLRRRLGEPRIVMCLGNGPSSEDPRLATIEHDCLIRVNWRWIERGILTRPDLVFVGDAATLHRVDSCVYGLWSIELERAMLLRHLVVRGPRAMEFATLERLSPLAAVSRWPARPSNGALAILTAVGLAPERIVIGGIDLFSHPDGRYPGAPDASNDYASVHRRDVELELIAAALSSFDGEVVIVGDILDDALAARRTGARDAR